jgi:hypothetical protein
MPEGRHPDGALVVDTQSNKLGYVMGHEGPYVQLRPVTGGREWAKCRAPVCGTPPPLPPPPPRTRSG